jgi:hypothetical protein
MFVGVMRCVTPPTFFGAAADHLARFAPRRQRARNTLDKSALAVAVRA